MLFKKTRDMIIETVTIVKGLKSDFKDHVDDNKEDIKTLTDVIKECHESCPEKDRFDDYVKTQNGTLLRIEQKYDQYHDEVKGIKNSKKTTRQVFGDIGKVIGYTVIIGGLLFGILRYTEAKKSGEDMKIERLLKELIKEQRVDKDKEGYGG